MYSKHTKGLLKRAGIEIHARHYTSPISLKAVCSYLKLEYVKLPLSSNTCGSLLRSNEGNFVFINSNHPSARRRFSLAHEIGHFYLGHDSEVSKLNDYSRVEEVQANKFATSLLMPDELFFYVHKENTTINAMADWLRVSPISVAIRCQEFGLRECEAEFVKQEYYAAAREVSAAKEKKAETKKIYVVPDWRGAINQKDQHDDALDRQWRRQYDKF